MNDRSFEGWKTKSEVVALLQCSERTVERMATEKKIQKAIRRIPGRKGLPVFNPEDIERVRQETMAPEGFLVPEQGSGKPKALVRRSVPGDPAEFLGQLAAAVAAPPLRLSEKLFLTLKEAAAYSGMPKTWLLKNIKSGELKAIKAAGWKIRRSDLEEL